MKCVPSVTKININLNVKQIRGSGRAHDTIEGDNVYVLNKNRL